MKTGIITGASSGLGREFVKQCRSEFPEIEEFWLIARREEKIKENIKEVTGVKFKIVPLDLARDESYKELSALLAGEKPDVRLLINNAGLGFWGAVSGFPYIGRSTAWTST